MRQNQGECAGPHRDSDGYGPKTSFKSHHGGLKQIGLYQLLPLADLWDKQVAIHKAQMFVREEP